jgi:hypothetical protein
MAHPDAYPVQRLWREDNGTEVTLPVRRSPAMSESMAVAVGLDVHARSIRLAPVRAEELLEERTLPYDEEQVERVLRRWPRVRCCYEAGPTGFGLYRHLIERGIDCMVIALGWCRNGRVSG